MQQVVLDADVAVPRRDGTVLRADVFRPAGGGRRPVLVHRTPYDKRVAQSYWYAAPSWYAGHGYAVVVEDVRGRHQSEGEFDPLTAEASDGADCVRWAAEQSWSNGKIGTYGYSYCGTAQLLAAGEADVPLTAAAPALALPRLGEGCLRQNGVVNLAFVVSWAAELGVLPLGEAPNGHALTTLTPEVLNQLLQVPLHALRATSELAHKPWVASWLTGRGDDPYWSKPSHQIHYDQIGATLLHVGGWYDIFRAGSVGHHQAAASSRQGPGSDYLVMAPWTHQPVRSEGVATQLRTSRPAAWHIDELQMAFFAHTLRDEAWDQPPVELTLINSADGYATVSWPPPTADRVAWNLSSSGRANSVAGDGVLGGSPEGAPDHVVYSHADPPPSTGGDDCCAPVFSAMGPRDQRPVESRRDVLVYSSPPLEQYLTVAGDIEVVLYTVSTEPVVQWVCRLCLVTKSGVSVNLCEGVVRAYGTPGDVLCVLVPLGPSGFEVAPGERLRLHVTGGSHPRWEGLRGADGAPAVTRSMVLHEPDHPSAITLPTLS